MLVWGVATPSTSGQKLAVTLAFVAAGLSFVALAINVSRTGRIDAAPLFGGLLMLALGLSGYFKIRRPPAG